MSHYTFGQIGYTIPKTKIFKTNTTYMLIIAFLKNFIPGDVD